MVAKTEKDKEGQQWGWEITFVQQCQAEDRPKGYFPPWTTVSSFSLSQKCGFGVCVIL